jgi:hypothetical protein
MIAEAKNGIEWRTTRKSQTVNNRAVRVIRESHGRKLRKTQLPCSRRSGSQKQCKLIKEMRNAGRPHHRSLTVCRVVRLSVLRQEQHEKHRSPLDGREVQGIKEVQERHEKDRSPTDE